MPKGITAKEINIIYLVKLRNIYTSYIIKYKELNNLYATDSTKERLRELTHKRNSIDRRIHKLLFR